MHNDEDWSRWVSEWSEGGRSLALLAARVRAESARWSRALVVEFLAGLAVVAFYAWVLTRRPSAPVLALAAASVLFVCVWLAALVRNARAARAASSRPLAHFFEAALAQQRARLAWYRFARSSGAAFALFAALWSPWMLWVHRARYAAEPWRAVVGFGGLVAVSALLFLSVSRSVARARAACATLEALRERDETAD